MACDPGQHDWFPTGRVEAHVEWPTKTEGRIPVIAHYVRCRTCKQDGFRRPGRDVIYTWSADPANWIELQREKAGG